MKKAIVIAVLTLSFVSCQVKEHQELKLSSLEWLLGSWENISEENEFYEIWSKVNDSIFYGESYLLIKNDTIFFETMLLEQKGRDLILTPTTTDQNGSHSIKFKLITSNKEFVFENKEHDFPQRIVYTNPTSDSLYAYIEGEENGKYRKSEFPFKKSKQ